MLNLVFIGATFKASLAANTRQRQWIEKVQHRLKVTSSLLDDVKSVKMLGLSRVVASLIQNLRVDEIRTSKAYRKIFVLVLLLCTFHFSPEPYVVYLTDNTTSQYPVESSACSDLRSICHHNSVLET
jgi:hypothetical protein